jgi:APA family basic amino acid/polyamine antiporter
VSAAYGPWLAFVFAWTTLLTLPVAIAAVARGFADYLAAIWPLEEAQRRGAAAAAITVFALLSIASTRAATRVAGIAASAKLLALLGIAVAGIALTAGVSAAAPEPAALPQAAHLGLALVPIIFAFDGSMSVAYIAGEVREPARTIPRSLLAGIAIVTATYVLINVVYFHALGFEGVAGSDAVAAATLGAVIGPSASNVVACLVMLSAMGTLAAQLVGNPRCFLGPAEDGLFPAKLAAVSPRTLTPVNAILLAAAIALGLVTIGGYEFLIRLFVLGYYPLIVVALGSAALLRKRSGQPREFAMPLYPLPLLAYGGGIIGICVASALADPTGAVLGLLVPVSGAIVYALVRHRLPRRIV